jgi:hypothetical protein
MSNSYDVEKVPEKLCLNCDQPIGDHKWREVTTLARFGQMMFEHEDCSDLQQAEA